MSFICVGNSDEFLFCFNKRIIILLGVNDSLAWILSICSTVTTDSKTVIVKLLRNELTEIDCWLALGSRTSPFTGAELLSTLWAVVWGATTWTRCVRGLDLLKLWLFVSHNTDTFSPPTPLALCSAIINATTTTRLVISITWLFRNSDTEFWFLITKKIMGSWYQYYDSLDFHKNQHESMGMPGQPDFNGTKISFIVSP